MNEIWDGLKEYNTLQIKMVFLFFILTTVTALTTLFAINASLESYRRGPQPDVIFQVGPGTAGTIGSETIYKNQLEANIKQDRENIRNAILTLTFGLISLQMIIALAGSYFVVKTSLDPLKKLNKTMKEINDLNLKSKIINENSSGEIGEVIDNFNYMIVKIQALVEKEKEFTQNISHELKTPISAMRVNLESIILLNDIDSETKETIQTSITAIDSLNKLIEDITLLSSIERKKFKLEKFNAIEIINKLVSEESDLNKKASIKKDIKIEEFTLNGSSELFKRALCNLIENGLKYSKNNPEIIITVVKIKNKLQIRISDNGIGIPPTKIHKIFERFYRIDESRSRNTGGSGLGLAITKEIIELFSGNITIKSELKKGTTFTVTIPETSL